MTMMWHFDANACCMKDSGMTCEGNAFIVRDDPVQIPSGLAYQKSGCCSIVMHTPVKILWARDNPAQIPSCLIPQKSADAAPS